jgi:putative restriction endonuclease
MKFWLGVTDNKWFDFLSRQAPDEVNFWQPGGTAPFKGLHPGAPFLFKLKRPYNHIAGGGTFVKFTTYPLSMVWDIFLSKNGASSRNEFENIIRPLTPNRGDRDPEIGCTVLTSPFFWPQERWIPNPIGWAGNIVRGRYYDTTTPAGLRLWTEVEMRGGGDVNSGFVDTLHESTPRYGQPTVVTPRLGQSAFRVLVTDAYERRCAITGESTLPVLEAAHIRRYSDEGPHEVQNGLLLRSDFHKLFDNGLVTVTPRYHLEVSSRIREAWFNGKAYYRLHGQPLAKLPENPHLRPNPHYLRWHNENLYQG